MYGAGQARRLLMQPVMDAPLRLQPYTPDPAALSQPLPFDLYTDRGVLVSRSGSLFRQPNPLLEGRQLFRIADDATDGHCETLDLLAGRARDYARIAGSWGCQAKDAQRVDAIAQGLIELARADSAMCSGMAMHTATDSHAVNHSFAVAATTVALGIWLGLDDRTLTTLAKAALTMNVSSLALHDDCAAQRGPLEAELRSDIGSHPLLAAGVLTRTPGTDVRWIEAVEQHHENTDGSGYPYGNRRDAIPLEARILRVADVWCALSNPGGDRIGAPPKAILAELQQSERRRLDDRVLFELKKQFGPYPPGSLVRLANRETALVTGWSRGAPAPKFVVSVLRPSGEVDHSPKLRLTSRRGFEIRGSAPCSANELRRVPWSKAWALAA